MTGYAPVPSVFQTETSTKLASLPNVERKGIAPLHNNLRNCMVTLALHPIKGLF